MPGSWWLCRCKQDQQPHRQQCGRWQSGFQGWQPQDGRCPTYGAPAGSGIWVKGPGYGTAAANPASEFGVGSGADLNTRA